MLQSVRCDTCDYHRDVYFSHRVYERPNLEYGLPVRAKLGWCNECCNAVAVEFIPEIDQLTEELDHERRKASICEVDTGLPNNHQIWAESRLEWRKNRNSPSRCLECGTTDIIDFGDGLATKGGDKIAKHPNCNDRGNLVNYGGGFVNYSRVAIYNSEGIHQPDASTDG